LAGEEQGGTPEHWSPISPGDLGLKAGYWTGQDKDPVRFRAVIGWITINTATNQHFFQAVVLSDLMLPTVAILMPQYCGVFLKEMTEEQAKAEAKRWMSAHPGQPMVPNVAAAKA
jgi:hypothetical protein